MRWLLLLLRFKAVFQFYAAGFAVALHFFRSWTSRASTLVAACRQAECSAVSSLACRQAPSAFPSTTNLLPSTCLHIISIVLSLHMSIPPQSACSHHIPKMLPLRGTIICCHIDVIDDAMIQLIRLNTLTFIIPLPNIHYGLADDVLDSKQ